jgi:hypothetical protein
MKRVGRMEHSHSIMVDAEIRDFLVMAEKASRHAPFVRPASFEFLMRDNCIMAMVSKKKIQNLNSLPFWDAFGTLALLRLSLIYCASRDYCGHGFVPQVSEYLWLCCFLSLLRDGLSNECMTAYPCESTHLSSLTTPDWEVSTCAKFLEIISSGKPSKKLCQPMAPRESL